VSIEKSRIEIDHRKIESGESIKNKRMITTPIASGPTKDRIPRGTKFLSALAVSL
jgi:hypothetical protein